MKFELAEWIALIVLVLFIAYEAKKAGKSITEWLGSFKIPSLSNIAQSAGIAQPAPVSQDNTEVPGTGLTVGELKAAGWTDDEIMSIWGDWATQQQQETATDPSNGFVFDPFAM